VSVWQSKMRNLRKKIKGWHINREAELRREKANLTSELNRLDLLVEQQVLSILELERVRVIKTQLEKLWLIDEIRARHRLRDRDIKEGDKNTSYLFAKANQRRRKKIISSLENNGELITENEGMLKHVVEFYKSLFGKKSKDNVSMDESFWEDVEKVYEEENEILNAQFSEEEIKMAIDSPYAEGPPGPDGLSFLFFQKFWPIIKNNFMAMVRGFEKGEINIARLNYVVIILIPKEEESKNLKKFRPISLINCSFKFFAKSLNTKLEKICDRLLAPSQSAFVKGRYILESVVSAHEIIHEAAKKSHKGIVLKLDYEKAHDRVEWHFLEEILKSRGFSSKWIS
jgi:hypothetical protein